MLWIVSLAILSSLVGSLIATDALLASKTISDRSAATDHIAAILTDRLDSFIDDATSDIDRLAGAPSTMPSEITALARQDYASRIGASYELYSRNGKRIASSQPLRTPDDLPAEIVAYFQATPIPGFVAWHSPPPPARSQIFLTRPLQLQDQFLILIVSIDFDTFLQPAKKLPLGLSSTVTLSNGAGIDLEARWAGDPGDGKVNSEIAEARAISSPATHGILTSSKVVVGAWSNVHVARCWLAVTTPLPSEPLHTWRLVALGICLLLAVGLLYVITWTNGYIAQASDQNAVLRALTETIPTGVYIRDADGRMIFTNQIFADIVGPHRAAAWVHGQEIDPILARENRHIERRRGNYPFTVALDAPGSTHLQIRLADLTSLGSHSGRIAVVADVTETLAKDKEVQRQRSQFRTFTELTHQGIAIIARSRLLYANAAFRELLGTNPDEPLAELEPYIVQMQTPAMPSLTVSDTENGPVPITLRDGAVIIVEISRRPIEWERAPATFLILTDVTAQYQSQQTLIEKRIEAEASASAANRLAELKQNFLRVMTHEIRTPLHGIIAMVELLRQTTQDAQQQDLTARLHEASDVLLAIVNNVLDLSKIEAGKLQLTHQSVRPDAIADEIISLLGPKASQQGLALRKTIAPNLPDAIWADPARIRQVLLNLVGNALKFTEVGHINIDIRGDGGLICFTVTDTGIGIPREKQANLFDDFYQTQESPSREVAGTGLGLAISRQIVQAMNGEIGVRSSPGRGTTFWFQVPIVTVPKQPPVPSRTKLDCKISPASILVVDDSSTNLLYLNNILSTDGHHVSTADSGSRAVEIALRQSFDIIFLDVNMPGMNGEETLGCLRTIETSRHIPIIAVTADPYPPADETTTTPHGWSAWLTKPLTSEDLRTTLKQFLGT